MAALVPAYLGGTAALSTDPNVGTSEVDRPDVFVPWTEDLEDGEIRVSVLGSGLPWVTKAQAAGSVLWSLETHSARCSCSTWAQGRYSTGTTGLDPAVLNASRVLISSAPKRRI